MTLEEIKEALRTGEQVYWSHPGYQVIKDRLGQFLIKCTYNGNCVGLTHQDGVTMNGKEEEFHILKKGEE